MTRLIGLFLPFLALAVGLPALPGAGPGSAQAAELRVEAPTFFYDQEKQVYRYEDARVRFGQLSLDAREIEIFLKEKRLVARGAVRFREFSILGTAERLELDLEREDSGEFSEVQIFDSSNGIYLTAERLFRTGPGRYQAVQCSLTTCKPGTGGWRLTASKIDYRVDNFAVGINAVLTAGPVPIFWFPWVAWPTVRTRQTGFLGPTVSRETSDTKRWNLGTRVKIPFFLALGPDHDLTLTAENISQRGPALEAEYAYSFRADQTGLVKLFGIGERFLRQPDDENRMGLSFEEAIAPTRYTFDWNHNQGIGEAMRLIFSASGSSDGQVRREYDHIQGFRPHEEYEGTFSSLARWGDFGISAAHRSEFEQDSVFADGADFADGRFRPSELPRLTFRTGGRPFASLSLGLGLSGQATRFLTKEGISGRASELQPSISFPFFLGGSWELRPTLSRRLVNFDDLALRLSADPEFDRPELNRELVALEYGQNQFDLELRATFARVFPANKERGAALNHRITPRLLYREVADVAQPLSGSLTRTDLAIFRRGSASEVVDLTQVDKLRVGVLRPRFAERLVTLRLDNLWLAQSRSGSESRKVAQLNLIQRYNLLWDDPNYLLRDDENRLLPDDPAFLPVGPIPDSPQEPVSGDPADPQIRDSLLPAIIEGTLFAEQMTLNFLLRYHHQLNSITETRLGVSGQVSARTRMSVSFSQNKFRYRTTDNKLHPEGTGLNFNGEAVVSEAVSFGFTGFVNLADQPPPLDRRLQSGQLFLDFHPGCPGCYALRATLQERTGITTEDDETVYFVERVLFLTFNLGGLLTGGTKTGILSER